MIYLSSFFKSKDLPDGTNVFSAAVYQPKGYDFPKAAWTDIRDSERKWTRPRDFAHLPNPLGAYRERLLSIYGDRLEEARQWLDYNEARTSPVALLCWCPSDKAAQRQLKEWGSFTCHTAVLGEFINTAFGVPVWYDSDRLQLSVLTQHAKA